MWRKAQVNHKLIVFFETILLSKIEFSKERLLDRRNSVKVPTKTYLEVALLWWGRCWTLVVSQYKCLTNPYLTNVLQCLFSQAIYTVNPGCVESCDAVHPRALLLASAPQLEDAQGREKRVQCKTRICVNSQVQWQTIFPNVRNQFLSSSFYRLYHFLSLKQKGKPDLSYIDIKFRYL